MKKLVFSAALLMSFTALSFAGTPKSDVKSETQTETVSKTYSHTYYVIGRDGSDYLLSTTAPDQCLGGSDPCEITTEADFSSTLRIDQTKVDTQNKVSIEETQNM